jgi:type II secretory pathway pseudopilin PulG
VTLVELLIAVGMMAIVAAALAPILHGVQRSWAAKEANSDTLANGLALVHHLHQQLSQASRVTIVSDATTAKGYLQFVASDGNEVRYDVDSGDNIQFGLPGAPTDLAGPADTLRFTCYDVNDFDTPITDGNSIRLITVEATLRSPDLAGHSQTFRTSIHLRVDPPSQGNEVVVVDPGVAMKDEIDWAGDTAVIDSYRSSEGEYDPDHPGAQAPVSVNAIGAGKITLSDHAIIRGNAYVGVGGNPDTGISVTGGAQITGARLAMTQAVDISNLSGPTGPPFDGSPEHQTYAPSSGWDEISTNRYFKNAHLTGSAQVLISNNITILVDGDFSMDGTAQLCICPGASLNLYVKKGVSITGDARANCPFSASVVVTNPDPGALDLCMIGANKTLKIASIAPSCAQMWAVAQNPRGDVEISGSAEFYGKIKADQLGDGSGDDGGAIHVDLDSHFE